MVFEGGCWITPGGMCGGREGGRGQIIMGTVKGL